MNSFDLGIDDEAEVRLSDGYDITDIIQLKIPSAYFFSPSIEIFFSIVFSLVKVVHKSDFSLLIT